MKPTFVSLQSVIDEFVGKGDVMKRWKNAQTEIAKMAQYYPCAIMDEAGEIIVTEEAEVISIETVSAPAIDDK